MASTNAVQLIWTIEGVTQAFQGTENWNHLSRCSCHLHSLHSTEWEVRLLSAGNELIVVLQRVVLQRSRGEKDGPRAVEIEYDFALLTVEGERWRTGERKRKIFENRYDSDSLTLVTLTDLKDTNNKLLVRDTVRVSVRWWPVASTLAQTYTILARSSAGLQRTITCVVQQFSTLSTGEKRKYLTEDICRRRVETSLLIFLRNEELCLRFISSDSYSFALLEAVRVVHSDRVTEVVLKGKKRVQFNSSAIVPFVSIQKLMLDKSKYLPNDQLTIIFDYTDFGSFSACQPHKLITGEVPQILKPFDTEHQMFDRATSPNTRDQSCSTLPTVQTCDIGVNTGCMTEQNASSVNNANDDRLTDDFSTMLDKESFTDFTLKVGQDALPVHKAVLCARSPVFEAMITSCMAEAANNEAQVPDFHVDTVRRLVRFIYTGSAPGLNPSNALQLFSAADKYGIFSLRHLCSRVLVSGLSTESVCRVLSLADMHSDENLKKQVLEYIGANEKLVLKSPEWTAFSGENPILALEIVQDFYLKKLEM